MAGALIEDPCDCGKRHWAPADAGATIHGVASVLCLESLSAPRAAGRVFSKKHGVVIPAHAGIQDSCDRGKRHWAPAYAGATINGVASVLFLERGRCCRLSAVPSRP